MTVQFSALEELVSDRQNEVKKLLCNIQEKDKVIKILEMRLDQLNSELLHKETDLIDSRAEVRDLKSSGLYQRTVRKIRELQELEKNLERRSYTTDNAVIERLKGQVKGLQTLVSNYKLMNVTNSNIATERQKKIKELKGVIVDLEVQLLNFREGSSFLTREGVGHKFTDEVEMCTMELTGECEV